MKYQIVTTFPHAFFVDKKAPLISIYQKTSRFSTDNKKDALIFKNLIKEVEASLKEKYATKEIKPLMKMLNEIEGQSEFWSYTLDGIALFASLDECIIYHLKRPVTTLAVVADSFHVKPLIHYFQLAQTYQILDLNGQSFQLFEASPYHLDKIELKEDIPTTMEGILGDTYTASYVTHGTYGGASNQGTFHGHGGKKDEIEIDLKSFFRRVDSLVYEQVSRISTLPLLLLAPLEYHSLYFKLSTNGFLEKKAIAGSYDLLGKQATMKQIETYASNALNHKIKNAIERFHHLLSSNKSSDQLNDIILAALDGRIETLLLEEDKIIAGKIDYSNKKMLAGNLDNPAIGDILDDLAQLALEKDSKVYILNKDAMPTTFGVAAIYRY